MARDGSLRDFIPSSPSPARQGRPGAGPRDTDVPVLSVGELNRRVRGRLENDPHLRGLRVSGEISNLYVSGAGHIYFTLKEDGAEVRCIMWRDAAQGLAFEPKNGLAVLVQADVTLWEQRGAYQLRVARMEPEGEGLLWLRLAELKKKLEAEGLFDPARKRALPKIPRRVGVVTSKDGAALQDILNVLKRRACYLEVVIADARVQGDAAPASLVMALKRIQEQDVDVVIIGRGGGSLEDLWAFNEEAVVRGVSACRVPILCAVGHETDWSLCDLAADERAPTPSAAAERVAPSIWELHQELDHRENLLARRLSARLEVARHRLEGLSKRPVFKRPDGLVEPQRRRLEELVAHMPRATRGRLEGAHARLEAIAARPVIVRGDRIVKERRDRLDLYALRLPRPMRLAIANAQAETRRMTGMMDALSPLKVLSRGYSVTTRKGHVVRSVDDVEPDDKLETRVKGGTIESTVTGKRRRKE